MIFELMYAVIGTNTGLSQLKPRQSGLVWKMHPSKSVFWPEKVAEEERRSLEDCIPKSTRDSTKWTYKIFNIKKWQPFASLESCMFTLDKAKIQRLDTKIVNMSAESLNLWLAKLIQEVYKGNGQRVSRENTLQYGVLSSCVFNNCTIKTWKLKVYMKSEN